MIFNLVGAWAFLILDSNLESDICLEKYGLGSFYSDALYHLISGVGCAGFFLYLMSRIRIWFDCMISTGFHYKFDLDLGNSFSFYFTYFYFSLSLT